MRNTHLLKTLLLAGLFISVIGIQGLAAADTLNVRFTPTYAGAGGFGDSYVMAVWLTTPTGTRICTLGGSAQGGNVPAGKVALWAYTRYASCYTWYTNSTTAYRDADRVDRTAATQTGYREYTVIWDWKKYNTADPDGTLVPDGSYRLEFESSNANGSANLNRQTVAITKGRTSWVLTPPNGTFTNIRVEYTPDTVPVGVLAVSNAAATAITATAARINGQVTSTAGVNPTVYMYWGPTAGTNDPTTWAHEVNLGAKAVGAFFTDITGLTGSTAYYFTTRAVTPTQTVWATPVQTFTTPSSGTLAVSNLPAANIAITSAQIQGEIISTAGVNPTVYLYWGPIAGTNDPATWAYEVNLGVRGVGAFFTDITGLAGTTAYYYTARAVSAGQNVWASSVQNFTTLVAPPGEPSAIELSTSQLLYNTVSVGQSLNRTFTIRNTGQGSLQINSLTLVGLNPEQFSLIDPGTLPATVAVGASRTITVGFTPKAALQYSGQVAVGSDDPQQPVLVVNLTGSGGSQLAGALRATGGIGGAAKSVALYGSRLLVGQGSSLNLLDISTVSSPQRLGQIRLDEVIEAIVVRGNLAYVALGKAGFAVVNLSNFTSLTQVAATDTPGFAYDIALTSNRMYIADGTEGLREYSLSNPAVPQLRNVSMTEGLIRAVETAGSAVYVMDEYSGICSLANPDAIVPLEFGSAMTLSGTSLYCTDQEGNFYVLNPTAPMTIGGQVVLTGGTGTSIGVSGSFAFVTTPGGIEVINIANPASPISQALKPTGGSAESILVAGTGAYVADGAAGLSIWGLTTPTSPVLQGAYRLSSAPRRIAVSGTTSLSKVFVAEGDAGLKSVNLTNTLSPTQIAVAAVSGHVSDIAISGSYAYLAKGYDGFQILNISKSTPVAAGSYPTEGFASSVTVSGTNALVSDGNKVYVLNVSSRSSPKLRYTWIPGGWVHDAAISGSYAYIATGAKGLKVYDLRTGILRNIRLTAGPVYSVAILSGRLYAACGVQGLEIYSLSTATNPTRIGTYDTPGTAVKLAVANSYVYVAQAEGSVSVINVATPSRPTLYAYTSLPVTATDVDLADSKVLISDAKGGLTVMTLGAAPADSGDDNDDDDGDDDDDDEERDDD